jgi:hypothetical protein
VLLIRDYGIAGWWAFAIPNVVGAAAMGWVLRTRRQSLEITDAHRTAIRAFSWITVAFHAFFICWIAATYMKNSGLPPALWAVAAGAPFLAIVAVPGREMSRIMAAAVLALSVIIAIVGLRAGWLPYVAATHPAWSRAPTILWCLSPVMVLGFLLCPYLDQTFHHARQNLGSAESKWSFAVGFGIFFAAMIVLTLAYSGWLISKNGVPTLLLVHLLAQSGITVGLHFRSIPAIGSPKSFISGGTAIVAGAAAIAGYAILGDGEFLYRLFMGFYGLPIPAYVLICMKPWRKSTESPTSRQLRFFAVGVLLAAPAFLLAVIGYNDYAYLVGLAIVLAAATIERTGLSRSYEEIT